MIVAGLAVTVTTGAFWHPPRRSGVPYERFEAVLALPDVERQPRATWAAYSLAEIYFKYDLPDRIRKADRLYREVQHLARNGFRIP
jgi:hypothetical protein